ncbi:hypothetical protein N9O86_02730 [Planktomarina temperata]|nr:hypothetical protein [Planktomarina temperata]
MDQKDSANNQSINRENDYDGIADFSSGDLQRRSRQRGNPNQDRAKTLCGSTGFIEGKEKWHPIGAPFFIFKN